MKAESPARILKQTYAFAGVALAILIGLLAASFWLFERSRGVSDDLLHASEQRGSLLRLMLSLQDAETGQRGYLLTGEAKYLEPYRAATKLVNDRINAVRAAYKNDPAPLSDVESLLAEKLGELAKTVGLFEAGRREAALDLVKTDEGKVLMDRLRDRIAALERQADRELEARAKQQVGIAEQIRLLTAISAVLIIGAAIGAILTILRYTRELVDARMELAGANVSLEARVAERTAELTRANDEIQRFAYIVSHDLRSPLVNVMGFTSELETSLDTLRSLAADPAIATMQNGPEAKQAIETDVPEAIEFIRRSTAKMDALIKAILNLSREGRRILNPERIDLNELFQSLAASVHHRLNEIDGTFVSDNRLSAIRSDRLALEQIFGNLIDNAIKYRRPNVPLRITVSEGRGGHAQCVIDVTDNGRGVAPEDHDRVFDLFRRAGVQDQPGEGIGLAHVRALVRRLGGDIDMTSVLGEGTTFRVSLNRLI